MRRHLSTPSPAMTVALLALFVALGGTGYATTQVVKHDEAVPATAAAKKKAKRGPRGPQK